jgi:hypothetical protein
MKSTLEPSRGVSNLLSGVCDSRLPLASGHRSGCSFSLDCRQGRFPWLKPE